MAKNTGGLILWKQNNRHKKHEKNDTNSERREKPTQFIKILIFNFVRYYYKNSREYWSIDSLQNVEVFQHHLQRKKNRYKRIFLGCTRNRKKHWRGHRLRPIWEIWNNTKKRKKGLFIFITYKQNGNNTLCYTFSFYIIIQWLEKSLII